MLANDTVREVTELLKDKGFETKVESKSCMIFRRNKVDGLDYVITLYPEFNRAIIETFDKDAKNKDRLTYHGNEVIYSAVADLAKKIPTVLTDDTSVEEYIEAIGRQVEEYGFVPEFTSEIHMQWELHDKVQLMREVFIVCGCAKVVRDLHEVRMIAAEGKGWTAAHIIYDVAGADTPPQKLAEIKFTGLKEAYEYVAAGMPQEVDEEPAETPTALNTDVPPDDDEPSTSDPDLATDIKAVQKYLSAKGYTFMYQTKDEVKYEGTPASRTWVINEITVNVAEKWARCEEKGLHNRSISWHTRQYNGIEDMAKFLNELEKTHVPVHTERRSGGVVSSWPENNPRVSIPPARTIKSFTPTTTVQVHMPFMLWTKLRAALDEFDCEFIFLIQAEKKLGDVIRIKNAHFLQQTGQGAYTQAEQSAMDDFLMNIAMGQIPGIKDPSEIKGWGHSHVNMNAFESGEDVDTSCNSLGSEAMGWCLSLVLNKRYEYLLRLYMFTPYQDMKDKCELIVDKPTEDELAQFDLVDAGQEWVNQFELVSKKRRVWRGRDEFIAYLKTVIKEHSYSRPFPKKTSSREVKDSADMHTTQRQKRGAGKKKQKKALKKQKKILDRATSFRTVTRTGTHSAETVIERLDALGLTAKDTKNWSKRDWEDFIKDEVE